MKNFEYPSSAPKRKETSLVDQESILNSETERGFENLQEIAKRENSLIKYVAEKFKDPLINARKESARLLAAFTIFMGATTAYAEGTTEKTVTNNEDAQNLSRLLESPQEKQGEQFDWKKAIEKIELSVGGRIERNRDYKTSIINPSTVKAGNEGMPVDEYFRTVQEDGTIALEKLQYAASITTLSGEVQVAYYDKDNNVVMNPESDHVEAVLMNEDVAAQAYVNTIKSANSGKDFFVGMGKSTEKLSSMEKAEVLRMIALDLDKSYNVDMSKAGQHVAISDEKTFQVLRGNYINKDIASLSDPAALGICGNISTYLVKVAKSMGMESWLQSGSAGGSSDVWMGSVIERDGKKEIMYLTFWGDLVPTGTLNYKDSRGIMERKMQGVSAFNSFVGNEESTLFEVKSKAQDNILDAANIKPAGEILEQDIAKGEFLRDKGLNISINPDVQHLKFTKDHFGLAVYNFSDVYNDPYQSMDTMQAARTNFSFKGNNFGIEGDATVMHVNMKDFAENAGNSYIDLFGRVAVSFMDSQELTKGEYGKLVLNYGTTIQAAIKKSLNNNSIYGTEGKLEGAAGARLTYFNPNDSGMFYVGASDSLQLQTDNMQEQNATVTEALRNFTVGGSVNAYEATVLNVDATRSEYGWGTEHAVKSELNVNHLVLGAEYKKADSQYERFYPDSEKFSGKLGYKKDGWEVDLVGFKKIERYASADKVDNYGAELKLKIVLWP